MNPSFKLTGLCMLLMGSLLNATKVPATVASNQSQGSSPRPARSRPASPAVDLERRYDALQAAVAQGDPDAVVRASRRVVALGLAQMADLRVLVDLAPDAIKLYDQSLALEVSPETRVNLALAALRANLSDLALQQTALVVESNPRDARAWHIDGKAHIAKDEFQAASISLTKSLALKKDVNAQYALAYCYLRLAKKVQAQTIFGQMLQDYGNRAIWHVVFAGAYREADMPADAVREFRRAIAIDPSAERAHFFLAMTLLEQNHWAQTEESLTEFKEAVRQSPGDYFANFYLGAGESALKDFEESNKHLKIAAELEPETSDAWIYLGLNAFQQGDYTFAKDCLLKAVALTGKDESQSNYLIRRAYVALGRISFVEGHKEDTEKYIQKAKDMQNKSLANSEESIADSMAAAGATGAAAVMPHAHLPKPEEALGQSSAVTSQMSDSTLAKAPLNPAERDTVRQQEEQLRSILGSSLNDWGAAEARQGKFQLALEHFHQAEQWQASTPGLMRNTGVAATKVGDQQEAIRALGIAAQQYPDDHVAQAKLGMLLFASDQYKAAAEVFDRMGSSTSNSPEIAYAWAYSLVKVNRSVDAIQVLKRLSDQNLPPAMLLSVGDLYSVLEDYKDAVASYQRALQLQPDIARAHYKLGAALLRLDRPQDAIPELREELKLSPTDTEVEYNLAYALLQTSEKDQALSLLRSIVTSDPQHPQAQYQFGKALLDEGHPEEAVPHLEIAGQLDPERDYVHYQLQAAYRRVGRTADAEREMKIYSEIKAQKRQEVAVPMPPHQP